MISGTKWAEKKAQHTATCYLSNDILNNKRTIKIIKIKLKEYNSKLLYLGRLVTGELANAETGGLLDLLRGVGEAEVHELEERGQVLAHQIVAALGNDLCVVPSISPSEMREWMRA
jgi:hypothetical protein